MTNSAQELGQWGEMWVAAHLQRAGYIILARNWRSGPLELDIVARDGETVVFVEVRTRRGPLQTALNAALESVGPHKRAHVLEAAQAYLLAHELEDAPWRVDVAAVAVQGEEWRVEIIRDALDW